MRGFGPLGTPASPARDFRFGVPPGALHTGHGRAGTGPGSLRGDHRARIEPGPFGEGLIELGRQPYADWRGRLTAEDRGIVLEATRLAGAEALAPKPFDSLSDGERQRVMIARALAQTSKIMVLEEITAFLDLPGRVEIMALLRRHAEDTEKIVLLSSHDLELSLELAGQVWIVHGGELSFDDADQLKAGGVIEAAFNTEDVSFDPSRRRFVMK
ncbi:MAG: ATP-binding cassette domain-containing protein [Acidobacteriota bacterium]